MRLRRFSMLVSALLFALPALGQVNLATINGTVTDTSGAVVGGARVEAVSVETGLRREVPTSSTGTYNISALPVGHYTVQVSSKGFKTTTFPNVELFVGQNRTLDARLQLGAVDQTVTVNTAVEVVNRTSAEVSGVIEPEQVRDIPVNGRNWATLMTLGPGAISTGGGDQRSIRFNGRSTDDNNYTFDGVDASGVQEGPQKADARLNISLESIGEFSVASAVYTAESGGGGGAQINVVSKTGSNQFHGGAFDFIRNDVFDARSRFQDPNGKYPLRLNQFGGSLGGPIVKNRTFFFMSYEAIRQTLGTPKVGFVPSAAFRAQVLAKSPSLKPMMDAFPAGKIFTDTNTDELDLEGSSNDREDNGTVRIDNKFTDKTTMFARFLIDDAFISQKTDVEGSRDTVAVRPSGLVLELSHIFSPKVVNEAKFGMNRSAYHHPTIGSFTDTINFPDFDALTGPALDEEVGTSWSEIDNLTLVRGRNTFKLGTEIRRIELNNSGNAVATTVVNYTSDPAIINNSVDSFTYNGALGIGGMRRTFWMGYGQDELKATPNLTLNLGLRYEYYTVMKEVLNRTAVIDLAGCGGFCPPGTPMYSPDRNDFAPRLGLAWSPAALHEKTVIRTGFGVYFGANQNDDFSDPHESTATRIALSSATVPTLSYPVTPFLGLGASSGVAPKGIDRHRRDLYYENWDFMIQHQFPANFVGQIGYVGSQGHKLFDAVPTNLVDPVTKKRPYPQFGQFGVKHNDGNDNFNALQASLQRAFVHGWLWQTQYMWSHAIADASVGAGTSIAIQNPLCRACDRSSSTFDVRHTITINSVYQLPFGPGRHFLNHGGFASQVVGGWNLSGIGTARTGLPVNITVTRSAATAPYGVTANQRPNLVPGVSIYPAGGSTINHWFNKAAFTTPAAGTFGNLGRFAGRGPGNWELDTALEKRFPIAESLKLSFRAEAFNLLNHPMYGLPSSNSSSSSFGRITHDLNSGAVGTGTPRRLQFMARLDF